LATERKKQVLVVDDEQSLLGTIERLLGWERNLLEVTCVNSAAAAISTIAKQNLAKLGFDLVITDIRMPGMDGIQLLMEVKKVYPGIKVVVMTAFGSDYLKRSSRSKGAIHYIEKPFDLKNFRQLVLNVLEENSVGFRGSISDIGLVDVIQMLCLASAAKVITIAYEDSPSEALIHIHNGNI